MPTDSLLRIVLNLQGANTPGFHLEGLSAVADSTRVYERQLASGSYQIVLGNGRVTGGRFTVTNSGTIEIPPESGGFIRVEPATPDHPTPVLKLVGYPVLVQVQSNIVQRYHFEGLTDAQFNWQPARDGTPLKLLPNTYQFVTEFGRITSGLFTVQVDGSVTVADDGKAFIRVEPPTPERPYTLVELTGYQVQVDLQGAIAVGFHIEGQTAVPPAASTHDLTLLPCTYQVVIGSGRVTGGRFTVGEDGSVQVPAEAGGFMHVEPAAPTQPGAVLKLVGYPLAVNVTSNIVQRFHLEGLTDAQFSWQPATGGAPLALLPSTFQIVTETGRVTAGRITVQVDGSVLVPDEAKAFAAVDQAAADRSHTLVTLTGYPVTVDLQADSPAGFHLEGMTRWCKEPAERALTLLPATYQMVASQGRVSSGRFTVNLDGKVLPDEAASGFMHFEASSPPVLHLEGYAIDLDISPLDAPHLGIDATIDLFDATQSGHRALRLLPSTYRFVGLNGLIPSGSFDVLPSGVVMYSPEQDVSQGGFMSGRASATLVLHGQVIGIDASAFPGTQVQLWPDGIAIDGSTGLPTTLHLLPQKGLRLDIHDTNPPRQVLFDLKPDGTVVFKAEYPFIGTTQQEGHVVLVLLGDEPLKKKVPCRRPVFVGRMS